MFLSIIRWLSQEKLVTVPPRVPQERVLTMTASHVRNIFWFAVLLLPGLAAGTGVLLVGTGVMDVSTCGLLAFTSAPTGYSIRGKLIEIGQT